MATNRTSEFERLLAQSQEGKYILRLYITGNTPKSARAVENIRRTCDEYLKGRYELIVIDLYQQPDLAQAQQIIAAPTLVKEMPLPVRRLIGDLTHTDRILIALDLNPEES